MTHVELVELVELLETVSVSSYIYYYNDPTWKYLVEEEIRLIPVFNGWFPLVPIRTIVTKLKVATL